MPHDMQFKLACETVAAIYGVTLEEVKNPPDRRQMFVEARYMVIFYLRLRRWSTTEIGRNFNRDHSSVVHATKRFDCYLQNPRSPERAGFVRLLSTMGHLPEALTNTVAGSRYLTEIFNKGVYEEFMCLNLERFEQLQKEDARELMIARLSHDRREALKQRPKSFYSQWQDTPLDHMFHRKDKNKVPC